MDSMVWLLICTAVVYGLGGIRQWGGVFTNIRHVQRERAQTPGTGTLTKLKRLERNDARPPSGPNGGRGSETLARSWTA